MLLMLPSMAAMCWGVYPIDLNTARACYDFERADRWPVFGL